MALVGKANVLDVAWWSRGVDEKTVVALDEAVPLQVGRDALDGTGDVAVHGANLLALVANNLVELAHGRLHRAEHVGFELSERVLDGDHVLAIVVFLQDLGIQTVVDTTLKEIWVVMSSELTARALVARRVPARSSSENAPGRE